MYRLIVEWPDHAFGSADESARVATVALVDASKALGVSEPAITVAGMEPAPDTGWVEMREIKDTDTPRE